MILRESIIKARIDRFLYMGKRNDDMSLYPLSFTGQLMRPYISISENVHYTEYVMWYLMHTFICFSIRFEKCGSSFYSWSEQRLLFQPVLLLQALPLSIFMTVHLVMPAIRIPTVVVSSVIRCAWMVYVLANQAIFQRELCVASMCQVRGIFSSITIKWWDRIISRLIEFISH